MFTGLIETTGVIRSVSGGGNGRTFEVEAPFLLDDLNVDDSVAINGTCLTATEVTPKGFKTTAIPETLSKTNLRQLKAGSTVNLERSLQVGGRLGGHLVQGHVDTTGTVAGIETVGDSQLISVRFDPTHQRYLILHGSITLDGISLTIARLDSGMFTVAIIPHTLQKTTVSEWRTGRTINLEFDLLGKYIESLFPHQSQSGLTLEKMEKSGY